MPEHRLAFSLLAACVLGAALRAADPGDPLAGSGIDAGVCLLVGHDDALARRLAAGGRFLVHGLTTDAAAEPRLRAALAEAGLAGQVTVEHVAGYARLPLTDHLADLVVADLDALGAQAPARAEIDRVLRPLGRAWLRSGGAWTAHQRALPAEMDEWTHLDRAADGNAASRDRLVGAPRGVQWFDSAGGSGGSTTRLAGGRWYRSTFPSIPVKRASARYEARSAFNGLLLWSRPEPGMGLDIRGVWERTTVADAERVYGILGEDGLARAWDARTGEQRVVYEQGLRNGRAGAKPGRLHLATQHLLAGGLLLQVGDGGAAAVGLDPASGARRWRWQAPDDLRAVYAVADGERLYLALGAGEGYIGHHYRNKIAAIDLVVALALADGSERWRSDALKGFKSPNLLVAGGGLFAADIRDPEWLGGKGYRQLVRLDAATGTLAFRRELPEPKGFEMWLNKLLVQDGALLPAYGNQVRAYDSATGADGALVFDNRKSGLPFQDALLHCSSIRAVPAGFIVGKFSRFIDVKAGRYDAITVTRGMCDEPAYPAYGLLYSSDDDCGCTSWLRGHIALHARDYAPWRVADGERLVKGPAYGEAAAGGDEADAWPAFLADGARAAGGRSTLGSALKPRFSVPLAAAAPDGPLGRSWAESNGSGALTAPVVAGGVLLVAEPHRHRLHARDAATGAARWTFAAGGRIDAPPTVQRGLCWFGSRDGHVYCLRLKDGALVWRFLAAPARRAIAVDGQLENAHPVPGSPLLLNGKLFVTAGRHNQIDGGIALWRLDPVTGAPEAGATIDGRWSSAAPAEPAGFDAQGRVNDVPTANADGTLIGVNAMLVDPTTLRWVNRNVAMAKFKGDRGKAMAVPGLDPAAPAAGTFLMSGAVPMTDRRSDWIGSKGAFGWRYETPQSWGGGLRGNRLARADGVLVVGQRGGAVATVALTADARSVREPGANEGKPKPLFTVGGQANVIALALAGDAIVVAVRDGKQVHVHGRDGAPRAKLDLPAPVVDHGLAVAGGAVYAVCADGSVGAFGR